MGYAMEQVYSFLDAQSGGVAGFGTRHGGEIAAGSACALAGLLAVAISRNANPWAVSGAMKLSKTATA